MRDLRGGRDVAMGETKPNCASDGVLVLGIGVPLATRGALDASENLGAHRLAGTCMTGPLGFSDRAERQPRRDGAARRVRNSAVALLCAVRVAIGLSTEPFKCGRGDRLKLRCELAFGHLVYSHPASFRRCQFSV
ncbi:MAG: hypothetical protein ABSH51_17145 [Solirubrobacteraceae bacterium]